MLIELASFALAVSFCVCQSEFVSEAGSKQVLAWINNNKCL